MWRDLPGEIEAEFAGYQTGHLERLEAQHELRLMARAEERRLLRVRVHLAAVNPYHQNRPLATCGLHGWKRQVTEEPTLVSCGRCRERMNRKPKAED